MLERVARIGLLFIPFMIPLVGRADHVDSPSASSSTIEQSIQDLGDESFLVRERAVRKLWAAKSASIPVLRKAVEKEDAEIAFRARWILRRSTYGIYPDTPKNVAVLAAQYRDGHSNSARRKALGRMLDIGPEATPTLMAISRIQTDAKLRLYLARRLRERAEKYIVPLLVSGKLQEAEKLLELTSISDRGIRDLAAFYLIRGRLAEQITATRAQFEKNPEAETARRLTWFHRTHGDAEAALEAARQSQDEELIDHLLNEASRWKELAERKAASTDSSPKGLGFLAAWQRLAGDSAGLNKTVQRLLQRAAEEPGDAIACANALFINDSPELAIELLRRSARDDENPPTVLFFHLCTQERYEEAFEFAEYLRTTDRHDDFPFNLRMAEALYDLGRTEQAETLIERMADQARRARRDGHLVRLARKMEELDEPEPAHRLAVDTVEALEENQAPVHIFENLFPAHGELAAAYWRILRRMRSDAAPAETLHELESILAKPSSPKYDAELFERMIEHGKAVAEVRLQAKQPGWQAKQAEDQERLGELYDLHGRREEAFAAFEEANRLHPTRERFLRLGHRAADAEDWEAAAKAFAMAARTESGKKVHSLLGKPEAPDEPVREDPVSLYLHGWALIRLGREDEGRAAEQRAELLILADTKPRYELLQELEKHDAPEEVARQRRFIIRTGDFDDLILSNMYGRIGNAQSGKNNLLAAEYWERSLLPCLRPGVSLSDVSGLSTVPHLIHKARGRGLLEAGQVEAALGEFELSRRYLPGEIGLALTVVPELERAKRPEEAEALFERIYEFKERLTQEWPESVRLHHEAAMLAVKLNRRLDDALRHARRAVELEPESPEHLATLAEVHHARGERREAIEVMERCLALDPNSRDYQERLERYRK